MSGFFEPLYTAAEMRAAEERYPGFPGTAEELMERAGLAVSREVRARYPEARRVAVVCGGGANGGDGRIAAARLREGGVDAVETAEPEGYDVVVDALFGTGFHGAPRPEAAELIERINGAGSPVVAVDIPSGVDSSTGEVPGAAVTATCTVTFHGAKVGHAVAPGCFHAGEVVVADIGLEHTPTGVRRVTPAILAAVPLRRAPDSKFAAAVLVVGGAAGLTSAAVLTATAALRADAGYVTLAVPRESLAVAEVLALEPVKMPLDSGDAGAAVQAVLELSSRAGALAIGPGLGRSEWARELVAGVLAACPLPAVVDADALFGLTPVTRDAPTVLTPHAGELARLLDVEGAEVARRRLGSAREAAVRFAATVLLKGADTLVAGPDGTVVVADLGPPSLATAGTGDVLTGIVTAFLAKGLSPLTAASAAAVAHGLAARRRPPAGLVASDLLAELPDVLS
ncbi:MAG: NAD(P)H-hydrate dehydratase [Gaiella sp.]